MFSLLPQTAQAAETIKNEQITFLGFLSGLIVAVVIFLIKDRITSIREGIKFRKMLASDLSWRVDNVNDVLPKIEKTLEDMNANVPIVDKVEIQHLLSPNLHWDNYFSLAGILFQHSAHLRPDELTQAQRCYGAQTRLEDISKTYNQVILQYVIKEEKRAANLAIAVACLADLKDNYLQTRKFGAQALVMLSENHWFLSINKKQFQTILGIAT